MVMNVVTASQHIDPTQQSGGDIGAPATGRCSSRTGSATLGRQVRLSVAGPVMPPVRFSPSPYPTGAARGPPRPLARKS